MGQRSNATLFDFGYLSATDEKWNLGDFGLFFAHGWRHDLNLKSSQKLEILSIGTDRLERPAMVSNI